MASLEQAASLPRMPPTEDYKATERRRDARSTVPTDAEIEVDPGALTEAKIASLSIHGCEVRNAPHDIHVGQFIAIRLAGLARISGIVRWARDGSAGVEFAHAIPEQVVKEQQQSRRLASVWQI